MNHRERVLTTLDHREPERVPIDIGGMRSTGMHAIAYRQWREYLGLDTDQVKLYDVQQQLALIDQDILEYFDADVLPLNRLLSAWGIRIDQWKEGQLPDGFNALVPAGFNPVKEGGFFYIKDEKGNITAKRSQSSLYYDQVGVYHPLADAKTLGDVKQTYPRLTISVEEQEYLCRESRRLRATDYAVMAEFGGSLYEAGQVLRGHKQWYIDLANKKLVKYLLDLLVDNYMENLELFIAAIGDNADVVVFGGDDLGMQTGPQLSPAMYRELFKPRHKQMWNVVKAKTNWKVFLHSCGSIYKLLPDLIEAGVDIINPVQIGAKDMEPERLKKDFGRDLVFWGGGCDTQKVLPRRTVEDVEEEVKKNISVFAPGGGFVFAPVHNIQPDVPLANITALYRTARRCGEYVYQKR